MERHRKDVETQYVWCLQIKDINLTMERNTTAQSGTIQSGHPADDDSIARDHPTRRRVLRTGAALAATCLVDTAAADHTTNGGCPTEVQDSASITFNDQIVGGACPPDIELNESPDNDDERECDPILSEWWIHRPPHTAMPVGTSGSFPPGYPVGATDILGSGPVENVCIDLYEPEGFFETCIDWDNWEWPVGGNPSGTAPMTAMLHLDTDGNGLFTHYCFRNSPMPPEDHAYHGGPNDPVIDKAMIIGDGPG